MTLPRRAAWLALFAGAALAQAAIPPVARVTDQTGTLTSEQRAGLEQRLAAFEQDKGSQVAVLIVATTEPETIEQYSIRVAEAWQLGRKDVDDGVLLLVAKDDRKLRIEVGYGLEGALPDAIAKRIIEEIITPRFRGGDFPGGIEAGVERILGVIQGEPLPPPERRREWGERDLDLLLWAGLGLLVLSTLAGQGVGEFPSALGAGGAYAGIAWWVLGTLVAGVLAGFFLFVVSLVLQVGKHMDGGGGWASSGGSGGGGGFGGGGFSGGGGGGGFSGGGGGFGGGGASGGW